MDSNKYLNFTLIILVIISITGCDFQYWWSRGQAPAPKALFERADGDLDGALSAPSFGREDIKEEVVALRASVSALVGSVDGQQSAELDVSSLRGAADKLYLLEDKLSITSRPAYAELAGQLRSIIAHVESGGELNREAFRLYSARLFFFLANELTVPPPG